MISEQVADLVAKVQTVTALAASSGLAIGGRGEDPGMVKMPLPAAWIMFTKQEPGESPYSTSGARPGLVPTSEASVLVCSVLIYLPYDTQDDLLLVQFPLLEAVVKAVHATQAPNKNRWRYMEQKLALVFPDRLAYEQSYTLTVVM